MGTFRPVEDASRQTRPLPASQNFLNDPENGESTNTPQQLSATAPPISQQNIQSSSSPPHLDTKRLLFGHIYTRPRSKSGNLTLGRNMGETEKHTEIEFDAALRKLELFERRFLNLEAEKQGLAVQVTELENHLSSLHKCTSKFFEEFESQEVNSRLARLEADSSRLTEELKFIGIFSERAFLDRMDPKMEPPPEFSGKQVDFTLFSTRLAAFLTAQPNTYPDDMSKVMYTASRLTGVAAEWFQSYLSRHNEGLLLWADFRAEFEAEFKDPLIKQRAQYELLNLAQMPFEPFEDYLLRFRCIKAQSQYPDEALVQYFRHGLHCSIRTTLLDSTDYDPSDLNSTISKARQVALRQSVLNTEKSRFKASANMVQRPNMKKWCLLHNVSTHSSEECKVLLAKRTEGKKVSIWAAEMGTRSSLKVDVQLHFNNTSFDVSALLDSGCDAFALMHPRLVEKLGLNRIPLSNPLLVQLVNGTQASEMAYFRTPSIKTLIAGRLWEAKIWFIIWDIGDKDIIIGHPWLLKYNPDIDWKRKLLTPRSTVVEPMLCPISHEDLSFRLPDNVPKEYELYARVFNIDLAKELPPSHGEFDFPINLAERRTFPKSQKIYHLSKDELNLLREKIDEGLAHGTMRRSKATDAAPVMFVDQDGKKRMCIDLRLKNDCIEPDGYRPPHLKAMVKNLAGKMWYTKLDLISSDQGQDW